MPPMPPILSYDIRELAQEPYQEQLLSGEAPWSGHGQDVIYLKADSREQLLSLIQEAAPAGYQIDTELVCLKDKDLYGDLAGAHPYRTRQLVARHKRTKDCYVWLRDRWHPYTSPFTTYQVTITYPDTRTTDTIETTPAYLKARVRSLARWTATAIMVRVKGKPVYHASRNGAGTRWFWRKA